MSKRYIFDAILEVMKKRKITSEEVAAPSKDLADEVSELSGKKVSSYRVGRHLGILYRQKIVDRVRMKDESHTHRWWLR